MALQQRLMNWTNEGTGCSLNIVFFWRFLNIFRSLGFPLVSVCVHNGRSNTSTEAELAEFRKITFLGKTQYFMSTLYQTWSIYLPPCCRDRRHLLIKKQVAHQWQVLNLSLGLWPCTRSWNGVKLGDILIIQYTRSI